MASAIGGAVSGFSKIKEGKAMERAGREGMANFKWQDLQNPYRNLAPSTAGAEMRREEAGRAMATGVQAARGAGARGIVGGVGRMQAQTNLVNRDIAANLDEQQKQIDMAAAQQSGVNQNMIEKRQQDELAGYGNMVDVGMDMRHSGMGDIVGALGAIDSAAMMAATGGMGGNGMLGAGGATSGGVTGAVGGAGGAGGAAQGLAAAFSDRRLKKNIEYINKSKSGLNIYSFEYINKEHGQGTFQGVMSDEIPNEAVIKGGSFDMVDYSKIDVEFKKLD